MIRFLFACLVCALSLTVPQANARAEPHRRGGEAVLEIGRGWQEAVVHVADPRPLVDFLTRDAGWRVIHRGSVDRSVLSGWGAGAAASGREVLLGNPGDTKGLIRIVSLQGAPTEIIRPHAQAWDPGGWFSLMVRTRDANTLYRKALARGFGAYSAPREFTFGGVRLRNVVIRATDGVNFALYERLEPKLEGWPTLGPSGMSRVFNVMTMTGNFEADRAFWQESLGWGSWFIGDYLDLAPVPTNFALPVNLSTAIPRRSGILWESPGEDGRVELMGFTGLTGEDQSVRATPLNRGITLLRMPVADIDAWAARARAAGVAVETGAAFVRPYGQIRTARVRAPNGALLEAFQPAREGR